MGLYDRPYYQDEPQRPFTPISGGRTMIVNLIIVNVAIWVVDVYLFPILGGNRGHLSYLLSLKAETLSRPWLWWQFLTYGFVHDPTTPMHVLGNMLGLFFLGQPVESLYGRNAFLRVYLTALVLCSVVWCVTQNLLMVTRSDPSYGHALLLGASGAVTTIVMLFILNFPRQTILFMMFIPMPAWVLGVLIVLLNLFGMHGNSPGMEGQRVAYDVHLVGAAYGWIYFRTRWAAGSFWPSSWPRWLQLPERRKKLKLHKPTETHGALEEQADAVLDKLYREGESSLTPHERKILEDYSRRMKQKHS